MGWKEKARETAAKPAPVEEKYPTAVPCASCGMPVRIEAAMRKGADYWHQQCPYPKGVQCEAAGSHRRTV